MGRLALLITGVVLGALLSNVYQASAQEAGAQEASAQAESDAVYVVVSANVLDPDGLGPYAEAAGPLALESGLEILGRLDSVPQDHVFEGEWPYAGGITIERFESMQALRELWYSDAYQAAIPLREGKVDINFVVAVPAS